MWLSLRSEATPQPTSPFLAKLRALLFFGVSMTLSIPLFISMVLMSPLVLLFDKSK